MPPMQIHHCRACAAPLGAVVLDLGAMPAANALADSTDAPTPRYPLRLRACTRCTLLQTDADIASDVLFPADYPYFSSFSPGFVRHAERFVHDCMARFDLTADSFVLEVASNDGYLLQHCVRAGILCLGVEPTAAAAAAATRIGVPTEQAFFGRALAATLRARGVIADLIVANNVIAHVPDLNDFVGGLADMLKPHGVLSLEFQHVLPLLRDTGFDTVYHEHYCYFSLQALTSLLAAHGLRVFDAQALNVHTGSLRVFACRDDRPATAAPAQIAAQEATHGLSTDTLARDTAARTGALRGFVHEMRYTQRRIAVYGAAAKATILLNACGFNADDIICVIDKNPRKQGKCIPGCGIPIVSPEAARARGYDLLLIAVRNLIAEVMTEQAPPRAFLALPKLHFLQGHLMS